MTQLHWWIWLLLTWRDTRFLKMCICNIGACCLWKDAPSAFIRPNLPQSESIQKKLSLTYNKSSIPKLLKIYCVSNVSDMTQYCSRYANTKQNNSKQNTYIVIWQNKINPKNASPIRAPLILNCAFSASVYGWLILCSEQERLRHRFWIRVTNGKTINMVKHVRKFKSLNWCETGKERRHFYTRTKKKGGQRDQSLLCGIWLLHFSQNRPWKW